MKFGKRSKRGSHERRGRRGTKTGEKQREEGKDGERQKANSEGRVVLILVDRNFRKSDRGRSKVTRWLQTHIFCQRYI